MIEGILIILLAGYLAGEIARRIGLPKLIGMIIVGILLGPYALDFLPDDILAVSHDIRTFALLIILFKAGLGLDKSKIISQGSVALRLAFLPAVAEASVVAIAAHYLLGWDWLYSWLLGWIICAASPAVIVPMMLRLKAEGWGVKKGIPDVILAGGTASDATAVTMFGIFLAWIAEGQGGSVWLQFLDIPIQILLGIALGVAVGYLVLYLVNYSKLTSNTIQDLIVSLGAGMLLLLGDEYLPYSSFLAVMVMGFYFLEKNPVIARQYRLEVDKIWAVGQIFLFVLIGAKVNLQVISGAFGMGLIVIGIGLFVGRWLGIFLSTWRSSISLPERGFMVIGDMAKATVQAAIGGIPLAMGLPYGEEILAISVLSILLTAPLGAWGTVFFAPRILEKGKVDPTRSEVTSDYKLLVAYDGTRAAMKALEEASRAARQMDGALIVLHIPQEKKPQYDYTGLKEVVEKYARDLPFTLEVKNTNPVKAIAEAAEAHRVDYVYMGKHNQPLYEKVLLGDTAEGVLDNVTVPVILVNNG